MTWYNKANFYHIYPLGMLGCEKYNIDGSEIKHRLLNLKPWIDYLEKTGITALYIGPLFKSVGHGYETTNYKLLDERLGDNKDLKDFVNYCHLHGIKVIFDAVFNHTGREFFAFKDIKEKKEQSKYVNWYNINFYGNNSYNDGFSYENWGGYDLLVKLNNKNPEVRNYLIEIVKYWVKEFDVDGLRLDAADVLDFELMKDLRKTTFKEDFFLLGEVIHGDYNRWVSDECLHSVTNYHLHKALYSGLNDHNFFEIAHTVTRQENRAQLYNFVDNHDVERIATKLNNIKNYKLVETMLFTLPGIPSIYYGSEFAIEGHKHRGGLDDEIRPAINIKETLKAIEDNPFYQINCCLTNFRKDNAILIYGDYKQRELTTTIYAYEMVYDNHKIIVCLNNSESNYTFFLDGTYKDIFVGERYEGEIEIESHDCAVLYEENFDFKTIKVKEKIKEIKPKEEKKEDNTIIPSSKSFDEMDIKELQDAILLKMQKNGPVTDQMLKSVRENVYRDSLLNWVRSFR